MTPAQHFLNYAQSLMNCKKATTTIDKLEEVRAAILAATSIVTAGYHRQLVAVFEKATTCDVGIREMNASMVKLLLPEISLIEEVAKTNKMIRSIDMIRQGIRLENGLSGTERAELQEMNNRMLEESGVSFLIKGAEIAAEQADRVLPFIETTLRAFYPESSLLKEELPSLN